MRQGIPTASNILERMDQESSGPQIDFLQCLGIDVSSYIMSFLDDPGDLVRASAVSWFWHQFVISRGLAKELCLKSFPQLSSVVPIYNASEGTPNSVDAKAMDSRFLEWDHKAYTSLLQVLIKSKVSPQDCIANAVSASSTDNYPDESVVNTLNPWDFIMRPSYWSSKGQSNPEVPETLIYKLRASLWVVTEIDIQPFEAFFQPGKPIYSAKSVRFRVGYPKSTREIGYDLPLLPLQKPDDNQFVWNYTSPEFPMIQENRLQTFKLPEAVLCIGGYLQIELLGRVQRQEMDGLFYICVRYVRVLGRPLFPAFDVEILEPQPQGKLKLKYDPKSLGSTLESSPSTEVPHFWHLEEEMPWDEDLIHGIQQGLNNPFFWDVEDDEDINGGLAL